jgi:hypothetical protein
MTPCSLEPAFIEYWETCDARQGGIVGHLSEKGVRICSDVEMSVGGELRISIYFSRGKGFEEFQVLTRIAVRDLCRSGGWAAYEYELEFIDLSEEGRSRLRDLLRTRQV